MLVKIILLIFFLLYSAGLFYGGSVWRKDANAGKAPNLSGLNNPESPNFLALQGTIQGKVTRIEGDKVYIETKKGGKSIFTLSSNVSVNEIKNGEVVVIGNNKESVKLNQEASMTVKGFNNGFAVTTITYVAGAMPLSGQLPEPKE